MADADQLVTRLLEGSPDSPESFDVKSHLESPVARLAQTNGFVRSDRNDSEERYVKKLSTGKEAWLLTRPHSEYMPERPMNLQDPDSGRRWEFILVTPGSRDVTVLASASEMTMNYLLGALLQRLATWPTGLPKPGEQNENVDIPPAN